jgi:predicted Zn-dependent protease with MMP-like domain
MAKSSRRRPSLADRFCEAIKELTAERQTRTYAAHWIMVHSVARHLGISDEEAQEAIQLPAIASGVRESRRTVSA